MTNTVFYVIIQLTFFKITKASVPESEGGLLTPSEDQSARYTRCKQDN